MAKIFGNTIATTIPIKEGQAPFYVTVRLDSSGVYSADKTYAEIYAAYQEGKHILVKERTRDEGNRTYEYHLSAIDVCMLWFTAIHWAANPLVNELVCCCDNTWSRQSNTLEVKEHRVSKISATDPDDFNYPSEKAVVDYVGGVVGDIETALDSINTVLDEIIATEISYLDVEDLEYDDLPDNEIGGEVM